MGVIGSFIGSSRAASTRIATVLAAVLAVSGIAAAAPATASDNMISDLVAPLGSSGSAATSQTPPPAEPSIERSIQTRPSIEPSTGARDPLQQPFASDSFWNMPIGSDARYVPANLPTVPQGDKWAPMPQNDANSIVFTPDAPMTDIYYSNAGWTGRNRCTKTGSLLSQVPIPPNFIVENSPQNEGAAFLMPNGRTINLSVPLARCNEGGYATSIDTGTSIDLYGNGFSSGIGAGGLTGNPGGVLRIGELRPGQQGPRHALRIVVGSAQSLYNCTSEVECWRWPATGADSGATSTYGRYGNNQNRAMRMGALLAIPTSTNIDGMGLETEPGRQLAWTLQNYGAYIGDATGAGFEFVTERGPNGAFADQAEHDYGPDRRDTQFFQDWGFNFEQRVANNTPWSRDVQRLVGALYVVDNNGPTSVGGGGSPLQPLAPAISPGR